MHLREELHNRQKHHPHLTLKQIYATITYYLFNQEQVDAYIKAGRKRVEAAYEEQRKNPALGVKRLMEIKEQREASGLQFREKIQFSIDTRLPQ